MDKPNWVSAIIMVTALNKIMTRRRTGFEKQRSKVMLPRKPVLAYYTPKEKA